MPVKHPPLPRTNETAPAAVQSAGASLSVLEPFLNVLRSASPITLPNSALFGGITHFISSLPSTHLPEFFHTLTISPSLWDPTTASNGRGRGERRSAKEVGQAVKLGVTARTSSILQDFQNAYLADWRVARVARRFLKAIADGIQLDVSGDGGRGKLHVLLGVLEGLNEEACCQLDWGPSRIRLEEEVVIELANRLGRANSDIDSNERIHLVCSAILCIQEDRLRVLPFEVGR